MYKRDTATEKEFDIKLHISLEEVVAKRFKQSTEKRAKVTDTGKYAKMLQISETLLEECFSLEFFSVMKQLNVSESVQNVWISKFLSKIRDGFGRKKTI